MHAVQCGEEGQVLSDFCFVGEPRVDVLVIVALVPRALKYFLRRLSGWLSKTAAPTPLAHRENPYDGQPDAVKKNHGRLAQVADA
jgi:hypothetical protein